MKSLASGLIIVTILLMALIAEATALLAGQASSPASGLQGLKARREGPVRGETITRGGDWLQTTAADFEAGADGF